MTATLSALVVLHSISQEVRSISAIRAARFAIGWSQAELATASGVSEVSIARMESGALSPRLSTISKVQTALEDAGVFITHNHPPGGFSLALTPDAVATSRRRYDTPRTTSAEAGQEQDTKTTTDLPSKAKQEHKSNPPSTRS